MFVRKYEVDETFFYRDLIYEYQHMQTDGIHGPYDRTALDAAFAGTVLSEVTYPLSSKWAQTPDSEMDETVRPLFHLGPEVQWRWPQAGEKIYHRPGDGYIGVWLGTPPVWVESEVPYLCKTSL